MANRVAIILVTTFFIAGFTVFAGEQGGDLTQMILNAKALESGAGGVKKDVAEAVKIYMKAAEAGSPDAQYRLGQMYEAGVGVEKNSAESFRLFKAAAEKLPAAMWKVGLIYLDGYGEVLQPNAAEAVKWLRKAAENDYQHQLSLINMFENPTHNLPFTLEERHAETLALYKKAAEQRVEIALKLGNMYEYGTGPVSVEAKDDKESFRWYKYAAENGHIHGMFKTGLMYETGQGVAKNETLAGEWYKKASAGYPYAKAFSEYFETGSAESMYERGAIFEKGLTNTEIRLIAKNIDEAVKWYRAAADKGDARAMFRMGVLSERGAGMAKNGAEAVKWYRAAADKDYFAAQLNLAMKYEDGYPEGGIAKNMDEAVSWYKKAENLGSVFAKKRLDEIMKTATVKVN